MISAATNTENHHHELSSLHVPGMKMFLPLLLDIPGIFYPSVYIHTPAKAFCFPSFFSFENGIKTRKMSRYSHQRHNDGKGWWESQNERDHYEDQDTGGWTILKYILEG
jgi:hypothetical protein